MSEQGTDAEEHTNRTVVARPELPSVGVTRILNSLNSCFLGYTHSSIGSVSLFLRAYVRSTVNVVLRHLYGENSCGKKSYFPYFASCCVVRTQCTECVCRPWVCGFNWLRQTANLLIAEWEWCACLSWNWCLHMDLTRSRAPPVCLAAQAARLVTSNRLHCVLLQLICCVNNPANFFWINSLYSVMTQS